MLLPPLGQAEIIHIAKALADTEFGFTGSELSILIPQTGFQDTSVSTTKHIRLYNAFTERVNQDKNTNCIYLFIMEALKPVRGLSHPTNHEKRRLKVNKVLIFHGLEINDEGKFVPVEKAKTLSEAQSRTNELRQRLYNYNAHSYVIMCCRSELLEENYFHAVFEAGKSLLDRIREISGLSEDGTNLVDKVFSVNKPVIAFNTLRTESERNQQNGLREMINGIVHMVRNVTAHELKIRWDINEKDAIQILSIISTLHKYLDCCFKVPSYP